MIKNLYIPAVAAALASVALVACDDDDSSAKSSAEKVQELVGDYTIDNAEYYAGGVLGTQFNTSAYAYQLATTPVANSASFNSQFQHGERFFERDFNTNTSGAFIGLGPLYVRKSCLACHPSYGHGKRQTEYKCTTMGNGYLLVLYDKADNSYLTSLTGMPQTGAVAPFKSPIDEDQIKIDWLSYTDEWGNKFDDGETYELIYPEVSIPAEAYYVPILSKNGVLTTDQVGIRLESTIGLYGTGLTDAIPDDSITAQWAYEASLGVSLNPLYWGADGWISKYKGLTGKEYVRRYTYAMTRGPLQDGPGSNAIWNITNVTRSDRMYNYMATAYAETASNDPDIQAVFYDYFPGEKTDNGVQYDIYRYLTGKENGVNIAPAEMSDDDYKALMVWHRGLAVPAARDLDDPEVRLGHKLFREIGCAACHRPSWTTGDDHIEDPNGMLSDDDMPRYPNQVIWPYTDMVQHRLFMQNDIRTGWCRTTPLWGRGLSLVCTGAEERLHDCRARSTMEAIMWHGNAQSDARWTIEKFRSLSKEERDAIIKFIDSI